MAGTALSIIPVALALILAFVTRDAVLAMISAIIVGAVMLNGVSFLAPMVGYFIDGISGNIEIILGLLLVGIWIELMKAGGGYRGFAVWCKKNVNSPKKALRNTFYLSLATSFHIYLSNLLIPPMMKPATREHNIPAVKVPMIISSTSSPLSTMLPFTIFILFFSSLIVSGAEGYDPMRLYIQSIPFMFYCMVSILFGLLYSHGVIPDIGLIKKISKAQAEMPKTEDALDESFLGGKPGQDDILALILPVIALLATLVFTYVTTGMFDFTTSVMAAIIFTAAYDLIRKRIKGSEISGILVEGFLSITPIMLILFVAFGFGRMVTATGFNGWVVGVLGGSLNPAFVPVALFLVGSLIAYATGSLTASAVIILPMGLPLAIATGAPLALTIGACVSGAQFGDLSSPLSDNMIMPSASAGVSPVDTAKCLLPYRLITLAITAVIFLLAGFIMA